jgi:hypothetical protein
MDFPKKKMKSNAKAHASDSTTYIEHGCSVSILLFKWQENKAVLDERTISSYVNNGTFAGILSFHDP